MNVAVTMTAQEQTDHRLDLLRRFLLAGFDEPERFAAVPQGATLFLVPDDEPEFAEIELKSAFEAARRGANVYALHVRTAELPE